MKKAFSFTAAALMTFALASAEEQPRHARILADKPGLATAFDDDGSPLPDPVSAAGQPPEPA